MSNDRQKDKQYKAIVIGASAGGLEALSDLLSELPSSFSLPILHVQHLHVSDEGRFAEHLSILSPIPVVEPYDKQLIEPGVFYIAPANYHMLVEVDGTISLSVDKRVNYSRPSIDVLFESAARQWGEHLVAVLLSGANCDGTRGMGEVARFGGLTMAQDPKTATYPDMPGSAINSGWVIHSHDPKKLGLFLKSLHRSSSAKNQANRKKLEERQNETAPEDSYR